MAQLVQKLLREGQDPEDRIQEIHMMVTNRLAEKEGRNYLASVKANMKRSMKNGMYEVRRRKPHILQQGETAYRRLGHPLFRYQLSTLVSIYVQYKYEAIKEIVLNGYTSTCVLWDLEYLNADTNLLLIQLINSIYIK
jgi:hypothetical protein